MICARFFSASLLAVLPAIAIAQPTAPLAGTLQPPLASLETDDRPSVYLQAAESALATGHVNDAQEALEMAQTRLLDRSVPLGQTNNPSDNPVNQQIFQARQALAAHDRAACMRLIEAALNSAASQGL